ncbi:arylalkylamine N-acetyltransferase-like 2 [Amphibalanus amphitrite]|uniref:arylalkylamine N-acetyltransferase-like 2 n=1 Tax=Amphibalanus amphitrite TaxID=1232801 RepID=UPI001C9288B9|nr:arylalkylamine N-acetyltransferase-like 2 [Amphibalanus amphitrite]
MENGGDSTAKIKYCSLGDAPVKEIEDLLTHGFAKDASFLVLCRNCEGGQPEDHRPWVKEVISTHDWRVSRVAVDAATGAVAGVCLCDIFTADQPTRSLEPLMQYDTEACRLLTNYLHQIEGDYDVLKALGVDKALYLSMVAVDERYRRQGISLELRRQCLELGRQQGCQAVVDVAISPFTRKALTKLGFERVKFVSFTQSVLAGVEKVDLSGCGPDDGAALMVRRL